MEVQAENVDRKEWVFSPYFWLPSMDVTSKLPGVPAVDLDLSFEDIVDNFDVFAISARGEYWWEKWGVVADGIYMDMDGKGLGPGDLLDIKITDGVVDLLGAYRFNLTKDAAGPSARLMAGGRYRYIRQKVKLPQLIGIGGSESYVEPVVGAQILAPISRQWIDPPQIFW
jgi:hypothetical protein